MSKELNLIFKKHQTWVDIVSSFGVSKETAEDITQEMYIKIHKSILKNGTDIMYDKEAINYYYIFKILRSLFVNMKRREKNTIIVDLDYLYKIESDQANTETYLKIEDELKTMYWYDRKIFEIITEGESISKLSRKTGISYHSLYKTFKKVKNKIKRLL